MAIKTRKLKRLSDGEVFRGVKVSARNYISAAEWLGSGAGEALDSYSARKGGAFKQRVRVRTPKGPRVAQIGDYIVKTGLKKYKHVSNGSSLSVPEFIVVKADVFDQQFQEEK